MATRMNVTVQGQGELKRALARVERAIEEGSQAGQLETAELIADEWRGAVPVDTGEYQRSIDADEDGAFATAEHASFVEFGTSTHAAVPAAATAAELGRRKMPGIVTDAVRREL